MTKCEVKDEHAETKRGIRRQEHMYAHACMTDATAATAYRMPTTKTPP